MVRFFTPFAGFEPPPHLAEAYRRKLLQQQQQQPLSRQAPSQRQLSPQPSPMNEALPPASPEITTAADARDPRFMQPQAGLGPRQPQPQPQAAAAEVRRLPYTPPPRFPESPQRPSDVGQAWDAVDRMAGEGPPLRDLRGQPHAPPAPWMNRDPRFSRPVRLPRENVDPGFTPDVHVPRPEDVDPGFTPDVRFPGREGGFLPRAPSPHPDLSERPRPLTLEEYQSLPPPGPPPESTKLHDLLGQDPDNALKFFNLTKWPPPRHLLEILRAPENQHLTRSRPHLVLKWVKDMAAARPELLTHNGAVRYLLNTLKDTLRTDYTRRGQPVPEDAQLEQETFQLIDHTLAEAQAQTLAATSASARASSGEPAPPSGAVAAATVAEPKDSPPPASGSPATFKRDDEFQIQLEAEVQKRKERDRQILDAAIAAEAAAARVDAPGINEALAEYQEGKEQMPEEVARAYWNAYRRTSQRAQPYREWARGVIEALDRRMNSRATGEDDKDIDAAIDALTDMPPEAAAIVRRMLAQAAAAKGATVHKVGQNPLQGFMDALQPRLDADPADQAQLWKGMGQQAGESIYRTFEKFGNDPRRRQGFIRQVPEIGRVTTTVPEIKTLEDAARYVDEISGLDMTRDGVTRSSPNAGGAYSVPRPGTERTLTPAETALIQQAKARAIHRLDVDREFVALGETVDPIGDDVFSIIASTGGSSVAVMGILAGTRGAAAPILADIYASGAYDELRRKYPEADPAQLSQIANLTGIIQAPLDLFELSLLKRLPGVKSLLSGSLEKALLKKSLVRVAGVYVGEQITEGFQDLTPDVLIQALKADIPGYDWDHEMKEFWGSRWKVAVGTLPLTLLGLGAASWQEVKGARETLADDRALGSLGLGDKDRAAIATLARAGRMDEALTALKAAMSRRDPAVAQQFLQQAESVASSQAKAFQDLMSQAGLTISREGDQYILTNRAGAKAAFNTAEEAVAAVQAHVLGGKSQSERGDEALSANESGQGKTLSKQPSEAPLNVVEKQTLVLEPAVLKRHGINVDMQEGNEYILEFPVQKGSAKIIANFSLEGETLYLRDAHIAGESTLKEALELGKNVGRDMGAKFVIIVPGKRTTGAKPGHVPRTLKINTGL